jgi:hypothetical protein
VQVAHVKNHWKLKRVGSTATAWVKFKRIFKKNYSSFGNLQTLKGKMKLRFSKLW